MQTLLTKPCWIVLGLLLGSSAWTLESSAQESATPAETQTETTDEKDSTYELMRVFVDTFEEIDRSYVQEVDRRKMVEAAVRGMLSELDPYSNYISPDDLQRFQEAITQEFGGVGIRVEFDQEKRQIKVVSPLPGSPAYEAGIHAGDRIVEIAGESVSDFPAGREIDRAVEMLRGKPGETIEVGFLHADEEEVKRVTLTRKMIQLDTVMGDSFKPDGSWNWMLDPESKIGYVRITHFTARSADEMLQALKSLKKDGMKGLILDLRYNPGGLLQAALDVSDLFIEEGIIVSTKGRTTRQKDWPAKKFGTFTGFPIAVLVNNFSASASEIVSACLQDHKRAIVIGERSYGKGSVQDVIDLENGQSALKLTTQTYHRPSGKNIHRFPNAKETDEWGVSPDEGYEVKLSFDEMVQYQRDRQRRDIPGADAATDFEDRPLKMAIEYLEKELNGSSAAESDQPADKPEEDQPEKKEEDKKAALRIPGIAFPKGEVS